LGSRFGRGAIEANESSRLDAFNEVGVVSEILKEPKISLCRTVMSEAFTHLDPKIFHAHFVKGTA